MAYKIPKIMAILNVTPDSFSDGGTNFALVQVRKSVDSMLLSGVDIIDIGAESTRPGATAVSSAEEIQRLSQVLPYVKEAIKGSNIQLSLDSRHFETINHFIEYIDWINDVECGRDLRILDLVRVHKKRYCFYFSTSVPVDKTQFLPSDIDLVSFFQSWLKKQINLYTSKGISKSQLIFDPGICFGLSSKQSLEMIQKIDKVNIFDIQTLIGHSRKSFLAISGEKNAAKRDPETHVITSYLIKKNIDYIRVHNFQETQRVLKTLEALYNT